MIRELKLSDLKDVLRLNNASIPAVNELNSKDLEEIVMMSRKSWVIESEGVIVASLLILGPGESYQSNNYTWLEKQFTNFCYVDRIMVDAQAKRQGFGKQLYETLEVYAIEQKAEILLCEVNIEPPNPQSLAFHINLGWEPFHVREHGPKKKVQYLKKHIF